MPPRPACYVHGPSLALSGSKGLWPPYPWWPDPSKRLAPGPSNQLAPKAEATAACAPQSWGSPDRGHSLHDLKYHSTCVQAGPSVHTRGHMRVYESLGPGHLHI